MCLVVEHGIGFSAVHVVHLKNFEVRTCASQCTFCAWHLKRELYVSAVVAICEGVACEELNFCN